MTITLEQIKEMKIPVGTPIELTVNHFNGPVYSRKPVKRLVYFDGAIRREGFGEVLRLRKQPEETEYQYERLERIEEIKVLKYQE